jgi:hypothetical protein
VFATELLLLLLLHEFQPAVASSITCFKHVCVN